MIEGEKVNDGLGVEKKVEEGDFKSEFKDKHWMLIKKKKKW